LLSDISSNSASNLVEISYEHGRFRPFFRVADWTLQNLSFAVHFSPKFATALQNIPKQKL